MSQDTQGDAVVPVSAEAEAERGRFNSLPTSYRGFLPDDPQRVLRFCETLSKAELVPKAFVGKPHNIFFAVQLGQELGLSPIAALNSIAVINGQPSLWGDGALALILSHPELESFEETQTGSIKDKDLSATCIIKRGKRTVTSTFDYEDAVTAKLLGKQGPWTQYPKRMMQMRARGFGMRDAFADAMRGIRLREEVMDMPEEREVQGEVVRRGKETPKLTQEEPGAEDLAAKVRENTGQDAAAAEPEAEAEAAEQAQAADEAAAAEAAEGDAAPAIATTAFAAEAPAEEIPSAVATLLEQAEGIPGPEVREEMRRKIAAAPVATEWKDWLCAIVDEVLAKQKEESGS